jgi:hypothetical protein
LEPSILPYKFGLIFMGMKQKKKKKFKMADSNKLRFSKSPIKQKKFRENFTDWSLGL